MFGAYLDESFDAKNDGFFALAAVVGTGWQVMQGETLWRKLLVKHGLSTFKASQLRRKPAILAEFATAIVDSGLLAYGLITKQATVRQHFQGSVLHRQYRESPYMLIYQHAFVGIAMDFRKGRSKDLVSFVCDENARYLGILTRSYPELKALNPQSEVYMGSCTTAADENCIPLQMADLIAGELRRAGLSIGQSTQALPEPLRILLDGEVFWKVGHVDEQRIKAVRELVDKKHQRSREDAGDS